MEAFVFANYAQLLQDAWRGQASQVLIAQALYDAILDSIPPEKTTRKDFKLPASIDTKTASKLFKRERQVHATVVSHKDDESVVDEIASHFEDNIVCNLEKSRTGELVARLKGLINDSNRPLDIKKQLIDLYPSKSLAVFLSASYRECLAEENKASSPVAKPLGEGIPQFDPKGYDGVQVPDEVTKEESRYVHALVEAYCDAEGFATPQDSILDSDRYHPHFLRQREDYFNADFVRHSTRGAIDESGRTPFDDLEREIHDGIIDVYEDDHRNGFVRLKECLKSAKDTEVLRIWARADSRWLSTSVKKGVCHILINDEILDGWVRNDE